MFKKTIIHWKSHVNTKFINIIIKPCCCWNQMLTLLKLNHHAKKFVWKITNFWFEITRDSCNTKMIFLNLQIPLYTWAGRIQKFFKRGKPFLKISFCVSKEGFSPPCIRPFQYTDYPQRMRLERPLYRVFTVCFLVFILREAVVHLNFRAGSTFQVPVCTVQDRTSRCNKVDAVRLYASCRLNLLLIKG